MYQYFINFNNYKEISGATITEVISEDTGNNERTLSFARDFFTNSQLFFSSENSEDEEAVKTELIRQVDDYISHAQMFLKDLSAKVSVLLDKFSTPDDLSANAERRVGDKIYHYIIDLKAMPYEPQKDTITNICGFDFVVKEEEFEIQSANNKELSVSNTTENRIVERDKLYSEYFWSFVPYSEQLKVHVNDLCSYINQLSNNIMWANTIKSNVPSLKFIIA